MEGDKLFQLIPKPLWERREVEREGIVTSIGSGRRNFFVSLEQFSIHGAGFALRQVISKYFDTRLERACFAHANKCRKQIISRWAGRARRKRLKLLNHAWNEIIQTLFSFSQPIVERFKTRQNEIVVDWLLIYGQLFSSLSLPRLRTAHCLEVHIKRSRIWITNETNAFNRVENWPCFAWN